MQRIVIAVVLSGLVAACGQQPQPVGEGGAAAALDYVDAVPIDKDAPVPVAQVQPAAKEDKPDADREPAAEEEDAETPAASTPPPPSEPAPRVDDATAATRRANETTPTPYPGTAPEAPSRPD